MRLVNGWWYEGECEDKVVKLFSASFDCSVTCVTVVDLTTGVVLDDVVCLNNCQTWCSLLSLTPSQLENYRWP